MNIDIAKINITDFNVRDCVMSGDECVWVYPKLEGTSWNRDNLILRSSIWRKADGKLISPGLKKFFNWLEKPDIYPAPDVLHTKIKCIEKIDGSCLIVSKYKGELITRTRRSPTHLLTNGGELNSLKNKYPNVFNNKYLDDEDCSLIFEWVTPSNRIVLDYPESELYLTNIIQHTDYRYCEQNHLDELVSMFGVKRPKTYTYKSIEDMVETISTQEKVEGLCVYYGNDQHIRKIKSNWYNTIHSFKSEMNLKNVIELFLEWDLPHYNKFCELTLEQFKYEGMTMALPLISAICDAKKKSDMIIAGMVEFIKRIISYESRRLQAEAIISSYGSTNRADMVFTLLDNKPLAKNQHKKLLYQCLIA